MRSIGDLCWRGLCAGPGPGLSLSLATHRRRHQRPPRQQQPRSAVTLAGATTPPPASVDTGPGPRPHVAPAVLARHTCHVTTSSGHMSSCCPVFLASFIVSHRISFQLSRNNVVIICLVLILVSIKCENYLLTDLSVNPLKGSIGQLSHALWVVRAEQQNSPAVIWCRFVVGNTLSWKAIHSFVATKACKHPKH